MRKKTINIYIIISIVIFVAAIGLTVAGAAGGTTAYNPSTNETTVTSYGNPTLAFLGALCFILCWVPITVAWVGALISLARQQYWGWFVCMLIFNFACLFVYLFAGPKTYKDVQYQQYQQYQPQPQDAQHPQPTHHWQD